MYWKTMARSIHASRLKRDEDKSEERNEGDEPEQRGRENRRTGGKDDEHEHDRRRLRRPFAVRDV